MKAAIQNGLYAGNSTIEDLQPFCSSGNCTWPTYRSLAICTQLSDITSELKTKNATVHRHEQQPREEVLHYLANQTYIADDGRVLVNISSAAQDPPQGNNLFASGLDFTNSIAFKNNSVPIADGFMIYSTSTDGDTQKFSAIEFQLEWCVRTYTTSVTNGRSVTQRHSKVSQFSKPAPSNATPYLTMDVDDSIKGMSGKAYVDGVAHYALQTHFRNLFQGTANASSGGDHRILSSVSSDAVQALFEPLNIFVDKTVPQDTMPGQGTGQSGLQTVLENIATGMTNV